ncbi:apolipoprotein N-acyltransferase [Holospora undulata HU1]|uniref:Apolipoprotein N-acyltransferase n=1 Tax=Holospora undulata HU1 TaxID=1321371 RepID=A0A061JIL5_9PROT|nr:apolipoprotein N-acyltransferase [Holospora undulata HU1]
MEYLKQTNYLFLKKGPATSWTWIVWGAFSALAWGPFYLWGVLVWTWGALITGIYHSKTLKEALIIGWMWGFGWHAASVFWIGESLWVDSLRFAWFWPFCVTGIPAVFSCYFGIMSGILWWGKRRFWSSPRAFGIMWCVLYSLMEYLKGVLFTGFPWNLTAYIWSQSLWIAQSASLLSSYGLGLITLGVLSWPGRFFLKCSTERSWWKGVIFMALGLAGVSSWSLFRLYNIHIYFHSKKGIRLVQPNIPQNEKQDSRKISINWNTLTRLSDEKGNIPITHVIWPETAVPFFVPSYALERVIPLAKTRKEPTHLIAGVLIHDKKQSLNSIIQVTSQGERKLVYSKQHLVPFGEYLPFRSYLSMVLPKKLLDALSPGERDVDQEKENDASVDVLDAPACIMKICYEIIFPFSNRDQRAKWILNLTNDGWFGYSPGPFQHLASAQFRAIETGLPVLRAANTGISAVFDGMGRTLAILPLKRQGYIDTLLPAPVPSYRNWHGYVYAGMLFLLTCCALRYSLKKDEN